MAEPDFHILPPESLKNAKRWSPGALSDRPPTVERRAANQAVPPPQARADAEPPPPPAAAQTETLARQLAELRRQNELRELRRQAELAELRRKAEREGFDAGYGEGKAMVQAHLARLEALTANMQVAVAQFEESVASEVVDLALAVARQVIRSQLTLDPATVLPLVKEALRAVPEGTTAGELQINPADVELIRDQLGPELPASPWRIVPDASIAPGGCRILTRQCDVDATLPARWKRVLQTLGRDDPWGEANAR